MKILRKFEKTNKKLLVKETGAIIDIVKFGRHEGVKTEEVWGVTSGYPIIMLCQLNMEYFEIIEK